MSIVLQANLNTTTINTSGWTAIKSTGHPIAYIRELSPNKVEPPGDTRTLILQESGAQVTLVMPFTVESLNYLETHVVEVSMEDNKTNESQVVGCKCKLDGVHLKSNELSRDKRGMLLVFMNGSKSYELSLTQEGEFVIQEI